MLDQLETRRWKLTPLFYPLSHNSHHEILLSILFQIGIIGHAHSLIKSYLNDRTQCVLIDGSYSEDKSIETGVPQVSISGPVLFILYLLPLRSLLNVFLASYYIYADDITIHLKFDPGQPLPIS